MRAVLLVSILLAGCATSPSHEYVVNTQYVAQVNEGAKIGGGQIIWMNYPTVRVPTSGPVK